MLLKPRNSKFNKLHKGKICLKSKNINLRQLRYGACGLKALESGRLSSKHIETLRRTIKKIIKRAGKL